MKKIVLLLFATGIFIQSHAQLCTPNNSYTKPGIHPDTFVNLAPGCIGNAYDQALTFVVPKDTVVNGFTFIINYMQVDSISGLPPGFSYTCNPNTCYFSGNTKGCISIHGNMTTPGTYPLILYIRGTATNSILGTYSINTNYKGYKLRIGEVPSLTKGSADATCQGSNGMAWVNASGSSSYHFLWSNNAVNDTISNLSAGIYYVKVSDFAACAAYDTVVVNSLGGPVIDSITKTDVLCFGDQTGAARVFFSGGNGGNSINWSNGSNTASVSGLAAAAYSVKITDQMGCEASGIVAIQEPPLLSSQLTVSDVSCYGDTNGYIGALISGGKPGYSYLWNTGSTASFINKGPGVYNLTVTDANGCSKIFSDTISEPAALSMSHTVTDVLCFGGSNGIIDLDVNGGIPPYSYQWSNGDTMHGISGLRSGTYYILVHDANGCLKNDSVKVEQPLAPLDLTSVTGNVINANDGSVDLSVSGGTPPYRYSWSSGDTTQDISSLAAGAYYVTVTDANNCSEMLWDTVHSPVNISGRPSGASLKVYPNPVSHRINLLLAGNSQGQVSVVIFDVNGRQVFNASEYKQGYSLEKKIDFSQYPEGIYLVRVSLENGESYTSHVVKQP